MEWVLVKTILSLAAVLGLMVGVVFLLRRFFTVGGSASSSEIDIRVLGTRTLQPKRSVCVVGVLNKVLVVGISEQGMQTLTEFTSDQLPAEISAALAVAPTGGKHAAHDLPFLTHLSRSLTRLVTKERRVLEDPAAFSDALSNAAGVGDNLHVHATGRKAGPRSRKAKPSYA
ncbi:MAG: flagellar biosynthetic protein FliO [Ignavibacteria bacterium]|nr:flagellar biosynthetic protein FliO [Ignavibacteria bacterium]